MQRNALSRTMILAAAVAGLPLASVQAVDRVWDNTGTDWNTGSSWTLGSVPGTGDRPTFNTVAVTNPNLSASATVQGLNFSPGTGTPTADGGGYTLSNSNSALLTLTNTGGSKAIYQNTTGSNIISAPIHFGATSGDQGVDLNSGSLTLSGNLTSAGSQVFLLRPLSRWSRSREATHSAGE